MNDVVQMRKPINESGIWPKEYKVLILPEKIEDTDPVLSAAKRAGIELPITESQREQMAQVHGILVAAGGNAFDDWNDPPIVGERVMIAKYAGLICKGVDGREYRLCNDKDIAAVVV